MRVGVNAAGPSTGTLRRVCGSSGCQPLGLPTRQPYGDGHAPFRAVGRGQRAVDPRGSRTNCSQRQTGSIRRDAGSVKAVRGLVEPPSDRRRKRRPGISHLDFDRTPHIDGGDDDLPNDRRIAVGIGLRGRLHRPADERLQHTAHERGVGDKRLLMVRGHVERGWQRWPALFATAAGTVCQDGFEEALRMRSMLRMQKG